MPAYKPSLLDSVESEEVRDWWVEAHSAARLRICIAIYIQEQIYTTHYEAICIFSFDTKDIYCF